MTAFTRTSKNIAWLFAADVFSKILGLVLFAYLTREVSSDENTWYGIFIRIFPVFVVLLNMGAYDILVRDLARGKENALAMLGAAFALQTCLGAVLLLGLAMLIDRTAIPAPLARLLLLGVGAALLWTTVRMQYATLASRHQFHWISWMNMLSRTAVVLASLAVLWFGYGVVAVVAVMLPIYALHALCARMLVRTKHIARGANFWNDGAYLLSEGWPIMVSGLVACGYYAVDLPLIEGRSPFEDATYCAIGVRFFTMMASMTDIFTTMLLPSLSRSAALEGDSLQTFSRAVRVAAAIGFPVAVGATVLAEPLIALLAGVAYLPSAAPALAVFMWLFAFDMIHQVFIVEFRARGRQGIPTALYFAAIIVKITLVAWLAPRHGMNALLAVSLGIAVLLTVAFYGLYRRMLRARNGLPVGSTLLAPLSAAALMGLMLLAIGEVPLYVSIPAGTTAYAAAAWLCGAITRQDVATLVSRNS